MSNFVVHKLSAASLIDRREAPLCKDAGRLDAPQPSGIFLFKVFLT
jgi:hypothetical protein